MSEALKFFGTEEVIHVYIMEYASNGDLKSVIEDGRWDDDLLRKWKSQLVVGLQHIHARGILHIDLKPANILLDENDDIRICDFGLSRGFSVFADNTDRMDGTEIFLPPESHIGSQIFTYSRDIFSLGVIFYLFLMPNEKTLNDLVEMYNNSGPNSVAFKQAYVNLPIREDAPAGARELYRGMVHPDSKQRLTIKQIMQSEYFKEVDWRILGALESNPSFNSNDYELSEPLSSS